MTQDTVQGRRSRGRGGDGDRGGRRPGKRSRGRPERHRRGSSAAGGNAWTDPGAERDPTGRLPAWITLAALVCALWIFTRNTVPALQERDQLRRTEHALFEQLTREQRRIDLSLAQLHGDPGTGGQSDPASADASVTPEPGDPQALMVAIDALHLTPRELLERYPAAPEEPESPAGDR